MKRVHQVHLTVATSVRAIVCALAVLSGASLALVQTAGAQPAEVTCHIEYARLRDGTRLATEVYLPAATGPYPVVLQRTPYNRGTTAVGTNCDSPTFQFFARNGYAALNQDVRGRYRSEGGFQAMVQEADDGYDAVEWAAVQPWSTGGVGLIGGSYVGLTQWQPAIKTPPHLRAMSPNVTASDYHDHWTYVNGAFDLWFAQSWILAALAPDTYIRHLASAGYPDDQINRLVANWVNAGRRDILSQWVWQLPLPSFAEFRSLAPYYDDWLAHPTYDAYWQALDIEPRYANVTVPTLNSGGWYDIFQVGTVRNFLGVRAQGGSAAARSGSKLYLRSSCHACPVGTFAGAIDFGPNNQLDLNALNLRWFDHWLKGVDNGIEREPAVHLFVMVPPDTGTAGGGFWISGDQYPLPGTEVLDLYLHSQGHANTRTGDGVLNAHRLPVEHTDSFVYNPNHPVPTLGGNMCCINDLLPSGAFDQAQLELRDDVLVYTSAPLDQDKAVIGPVSLELWAATLAPDTDFTAKLVDVHLDGFAQNVLDRVVRARFRDGSKSPPSLLTPGQGYQYRLDLGNTAIMLKRGHRIRLEISSSNFPHYDRNLNTEALPERGGEMRLAQQIILHDAAHPSHLELPVVPGIQEP
jgi:putative CocE/NonD family hydrolase